MADLGSQNGSKMGPKTHQNRRQNRASKKYLFKTVLGRSWTRFGRLLGPILAPKLAQVRSKTALKTRFFEKSDFLRNSAKNQQKINILGLQGRPKTSQDRPKTLLKRYFLDARYDFLKKVIFYEIVQKPAENQHVWALGAVLGRSLYKYVKNSLKK